MQKWYESLYESHCMVSVYNAEGHASTVKGTVTMQGIWQVTTARLQLDIVPSCSCRCLQSLYNNLPITRQQSPTPLTRSRYWSDKSSSVMSACLAVWLTRRESAVGWEDEIMAPGLTLTLLQIEVNECRVRVVLYHRWLVSCQWSHWYIIPDVKCHNSIFPL